MLIQKIENTINWKQSQVKLIQEVLNNLKLQELLRHVLSAKRAQPKQALVSLTIRERHNGASVSW